MMNNELNVKKILYFCKGKENYYINKELYDLLSNVALEYSLKYLS